MAKTEVTIPLGIPNVRVLKTKVGERGEIIITIESTKSGKWIMKLHGQEDWHDSNSPHSFSYDSVAGTLERRIESNID